MNERELSQDEVDQCMEVLRDDVREEPTPLQLRLIAWHDQFRARVRDKRAENDAMGEPE